MATRTRQSWLPLLTTVPVASMNHNFDEQALTGGFRNNEWHLAYHISII